MILDPVTALAYDMTQLAESRMPSRIRSLADDLIDDLLAYADEHDASLVRDYETRTPDGIACPGVYLNRVEHYRVVTCRYAALIPRGMSMHEAEQVARKETYYQGAINDHFRLEVDELIGLEDGDGERNYQFHISKAFNGKHRTLVVQAIAEDTPPVAEEEDGDI